MQEKTNRLSCFVKQTGLNISTTKTKTLLINASTTEPILADGESLEKVDEFTYLGSIVSINEATHKDINSRLGKAQCAFAVLRPIWRSKQLRLKTKIRIYNSNVKSVLLYGSECWRVIQSNMKRLDAFNNRCLRRICGIYWPNVISNKDLFKVTKTRCLTDDIKCRRMRWLGHVFRMEPDRTAKIALRCTPLGKRKPGRPRTTWRRTITTELAENHLTLGEAQNRARDRLWWKQGYIWMLCRVALGTQIVEPTFSVRPRSSVGRVTVDLIRRSWVRFPPRSKDFFFASCGSLFPFTRANAQWVSWVY